MGIPGLAALRDRAGLVLHRDLVLGTLMERLARIHGDRTLVSEKSSTLTYTEAAERVDRFAGGIAARIDPGDRVVVDVASSYDQLLVALAASRAGGIPVPVNPKMSRGEIDHVIADSGATLVVDSIPDILGEPLGRCAPCRPGDVGAVFYTSGTTGQPKGARLTHKALLGQVASGAAWPSRLHRDEAVVGLPVAHIMGFVVLVGFAAAGIPVYFLRRFNAGEALDAIEERRATMFVGVPAMYRLMLEAGADKRDLGSIRLWASGADKLPDDLARQFKKMGATVTLPVVGSVGEAAFAEGYGMVELAGGVSAKFSPPFMPFGLGDFMGFPIPPYRFKVVSETGRPVAPGQVGELMVKGPGVLEGYHGQPEATREVLTADGWLHTGDLARRGPLGSVFFAGRSKDVIKNGGYSVFAAEVEQVLEQHPAVAEAAVVGLPDDKKGEVPAAAVRLRARAKATPDEIIAFARENLAGYKTPRRVLIVKDLPRTGTDKVQKDKVRQLFL